MAISTAVISLIVLGLLFLLVVIALFVFACWYYYRRRQRKRAEKYGYFNHTSLDGRDRLANGKPRHPVTNGGLHTISNGHVNGGHYNVNRTRTASAPGYATRTGRGRDEVDAPRPYLGHHRSSYHDSPHIRGPQYVYDPPRATSSGSRPPTYVVTRSGIYPQPTTSHRKLNSPTSRPSALERYNQVPIVDYAERRTLDPTTTGMSVDDPDGTALYLRWSPTLARRKREVREALVRRGARDVAAVGGVDRPASVGSFKIATNTLPLPRHKAALPSPIPVVHSQRRP